jgi:hypothetical protein
VAPVWVDGRKVPAVEASLSLAVGTHLLQLGPDGDVAVSLQVEPGGMPTLIVPAALPPDAVEWIAEPDTRWALAAALGATIGEDRTVLLATSQALWRGKTSTDAWTVVSADGAGGVQTAPAPVTAELPVQPQPVGVLSPDTDSGSPSFHRPLLWSGVACVVAGGGFWGLGFGQAKAAERYAEDWTQWPSAETEEDWQTNYEDTKERGEAALQRSYVGLGVAGVGVAMVAVAPFIGQGEATAVQLGLAGPRPFIRIRF